jgi:hypothetical protein
MMMKAVRTSETSVYFCETTRRYIPAGYLDTCRRENLESQSESDQFDYRSRSGYPGRTLVVFLVL